MTPLALALLLCHAGADPSLVQLQGWHDGERVQFLAKPLPGHDRDGRRLFLRADAARAFQGLLERALRDGHDLRVTYAHRTEAQQRRLRSEAPRLAARVGYSDHQAGLSIDIAGTRHKGHRTRLYRWLARHAPEFGFTNDVRREPWHWSYHAADRP